MSVEDICKEVEGLSVEEIKSKYSKSKLIEMYKDLYTIEPRSCYTKRNLAFAIWDFISDRRRTEDLFKWRH